MTRRARPRSNPHRGRPTLPRALILALLALPLCASAYNYPTVDRVEYVTACMRSADETKRYEMLYKCSCMIDYIAGKVKYDDYVELSTASKASTVSGERGTLIRDTHTSMALVKKFRQLEADAKKACFVEK
jgi:hypothetical protein